MGKNKIAIILGTVCFITTIAIFVQIKTIKASTEKVGITLSDKSELRDELLKWQGQYTILFNDLEQKQKDLETARTKASSNNQEGISMEAELEKDNELLGLTEIKGDGVIIKLDDNRNVSGKNVANISEYLVHEGDLLQIVNELFNAGADAISINGQRIVSTSSILCDGVIIRVNGEKIGVPLTIQAIGYPERLYYALMRPQGYLDIMQDDGVIVEIEKSQNITIPKYSGIYNYDYINKEE